MGKMSFLQHTSNADASCIVFCRSQANLLLQERNRKCEAILLKVYDEDGNVFFVWGDYNKFAFKTTYLEWVTLNTPSMVLDKPIQKLCRTG